MSNDTSSLRASRASRQRDTVRAVVEAAGRPLSPQEILLAAQTAVPSIGLSTVYRNLKLLHEAGELQAVTLPGDGARYETAHRAHHHHFHCEKCDRVFDVHACPGELGKMAPAGFSVDRHEITLYGRCRDCVTAKLAKRTVSRRASSKPR